MYWRGKNKRKSQWSMRWLGPGIVIGDEGLANVWISHRKAVTDRVTCCTTKKCTSTTSQDTPTTFLLWPAPICVESTIRRSDACICPQVSNTNWQNTGGAAAFSSPLFASGRFAVRLWKTPRVCVLCRPSHQIVAHGLDLMRTCFLLVSTVHRFPLSPLSAAYPRH